MTDDDQTSDRAATVADKQAQREAEREARRAAIPYNRDAPSDHAVGDQA